MNPADDHRDRDVDAAWRAASDELPPRTLDAAIAAAARRAVGAGPSRTHASRAWWPVAAAAVVAAVAVGIVEMTPPEEVVPAASTATENATTVSEPLPAARPQQAPEPPAQASERTTQSAAPITTSPTAASPPRPKVRERTEAARMQAPVEVAKPLLEPERRANAFPADRADRGSVSNGAATAPASTPPESSRQKLLQPPAADAAAGSPATADERKAESPQAAGALRARDASAIPAAPAALAKPTLRSEAQLDRADPATVEAWIARIRRFKAEGRNDLAAREVAAFRERYGSAAEGLLPSDLREVKP